MKVYKFNYWKISILVLNEKKIIIKIIKIKLPIPFFINYKIVSETLQRHCRYF